MSISESTIVRFVVNLDFAQSKTHSVRLLRCWANHSNVQFIFRTLGGSFVSGQFWDYAQSQRHGVRLPRCRAKLCPFLLFLVDYFFSFPTLATASGVQVASCRLSPRPRRSRRGKATPTRPQALPCSTPSGRPPPSPCPLPRPRRCRSAGITVVNGRT